MSKINELELLPLQTKSPLPYLPKIIINADIAESSPLVSPNHAQELEQKTKEVPVTTINMDPPNPRRQSASYIGMGPFGFGSQNRSSPHHYAVMPNPLQSFHPENNNKYHTITFSDVVQELKTQYNFEESITSTSLDILALYLKGQKILHVEAKTLYTKRLHGIMLPTIIISSMCAILNFALQGVPFGAVAISSCNVINAFLMALLSYLKLDAKAQAHQISAYKYQKLESYCEFISGRILFFKDTSDVEKIVNDIHNRVLEIKESNQFILPEEIRYRFDQIYSTNVFTLVKTIQNKELLIINDLKVIIQRMQYLRRLKIDEKEKREKLVRELEDAKIAVLNFNYNRQYSYEEFFRREMDNIFYREHPEVENEEETKKIYKVLATQVDTERLNKLLDENQQIYQKKVETIQQDLKECDEKIAEYASENEKLEMDKVVALEKAIAHRQEYFKLSETYKDSLDMIKSNRVRCCRPCC
jgi:hypothetical protein